MKIYLFRSEEISADRFRAITGILKRFNRPIEFIVREEDIAENPDENQGERGGAGPVIKGNTEFLKKSRGPYFLNAANNSAPQTGK